MVAVKLMQRKKLIDERISSIKRQKQLLFENLRTTDGIKVFPSQTNFLIFQVKKNAKVLFEKLLSENVLIRDVSSYPLLNNTLRVNAGTEAENRTFLSALKKNL